MELFSVIKTRVPCFLDDVVRVKCKSCKLMQQFDFNMHNTH